MNIESNYICLIVKVYEQDIQVEISTVSDTDGTKAMSGHQDAHIIHLLVAILTCVLLSRLVISFTIFILFTYKRKVNNGKEVDEIASRVSGENLL